MTRIAAITIALLLCNLLLRAQERNVDTSLSYLQLDEVVISANRFEEKKRNVAQQVDVISSRTIASVNAQNTGDLLMSTGNVFVQKSQQGGSSPSLRGFEASRVLLVIDGVRMNNAIYRAGHLQNVITVDQNMLERAEVMYGPSSTQYGSDALGGVIHFRTRKPELATSGRALFKGNAFTRFSSANHEKTAHLDVNLGLKKWAFLTSMTYSDFDDLRMGTFSRNYRDFGKRPRYIGQVNGVDSMLQNSDNRVQKFSGYRQWDLAQKIRFQPGDKFSHVLNLQFSNSSDIPRYDRLQDVANGALRYASWYYGPQKRNLYAYEFNAERLTSFFNQVRANVNMQDIEESRHTREYRRYDRLDSRIETIRVFGATIDARKMWVAHELSVGLDGQLNDLTSVARRTNLLTGAISKLDSRYPDGDNLMTNVALFAQHTWKIDGGRWVLNDGLRLQSTTLRSTIIDTATQLHLPFTAIRQQHVALTGNIGLVYHAGNDLRFSTVFSSGFRAPNIDDLARIFESTTGSASRPAQIVVPNPDIRPEYTYNLDLSVSKVFAQKIKLEGTAFYTLFRNAITLAAFRYRGSDSLLYQGVMAQVLANQNSNRAYLYGFQARLTADLTASLSFSSTLNYTYGRYETDPSKLTLVYEKLENGSYAAARRNVSSKPLDHIPPVFGKTSLLFHRACYIVEAFTMYNGWKTLEAYNPDGEDNAQYATPQGSPSWVTFNLRTSLKISKVIRLQAAVENIADRNYRYFASGLSAPGRNVIATLRAAF